MDRRHALGIGLVLVAGASFASGSVLATLAYAQGLDWLVVMWWRFAIGAGLAWAWVLGSARRRGVLRSMARRQLLVALGLGALYSGNAGTYYAGIEIIPAALAGVLVYVYPVFVAVLSLRFATRLPGRRPWIALGLAVAGVIMALGGIDLRAQLRIDGLVLILSSAAIYSVWIVLSARLSGETRDRLGRDAPPSPETARDAAVATALMMTATATVFGLLAMVTGRSVQPSSVPLDAWPFLLGIGLIPTFTAIQTLYAGTRRIGAAQAALVSTTEPLFIVILSFVFLDQRLAPLQLAGAALILAGVIIAQTAPRPEGEPQPARPLDAEGGA